MERTYRASNVVFIYVVLLLFDALVLGAAALGGLRGGAILSGALFLVLSLLCLGSAATLFWQCARVSVSVTPDTLVVRGLLPVRRMHWSDVLGVREVRGPAYQLSLRRLLPGPYLPHGLVRGETVLEIIARPAMRIVLRRSLVDSYGALKQDVLRSVPKEAEIDLHARWWRD